ncbi:MAG: 30S ribosomal protein S20 [Spirochaetes bacterium]|nr:MAG: 30S ribosomal protein S20 [Spirochaetota bacterium]
MPNKISAAKRQRQNEKRRLRNRTIRSRIRGSARKLIELVNEKKKDEAELQYKELTSLIDRAVSKGVYHKNTAARKKSRMYRLLKKIE